MRLPSFPDFLLVLLLVATTTDVVRGDETPAGLVIAPQAITLHGPQAKQQLIVTGEQAGRSVDLTRKVTYRSETPQVVTVDEAGLITAVADGEGIIVAVSGELQTQVTCRVWGTATRPPVDFHRDVVPVLTRFGCNQGACHGKARGQNGFALSLLGFDFDFDYIALAKEARGRRVFLPDPARSLLLTKPSGEVPHGGGIRLKKEGDGYDILRRWIQAGMPESQPETPTLLKVAVEPIERVMGHDTAQQLIVTAHYSDGSTRDVTRLAAYQSNESPIAAVDEAGLVKTHTVVGEAAVMARYMGQIAVCNIAVPLPGDVPAELYAKLPRNNFIDEHVWTKLQRLGLTPSDPAPDHKFLRRLYLDIIGRPPTSAEARAFLNDEAPQKREALIDDLLERPEYADFWANKWVDLLRPNPYRVGIKAVFNYDAWIRDSFRKNKPYDQFVRELVSAQGSTWRNGAVTLFRDRRDPAELTTITSQLFLGVRLECAKCHHHPFEIWGQEDFYSFAAYFAHIGRKGGGLSPPISGAEEILFSNDRGSVRHPITQKVMEPRPLFGTPPPIGANGDRRKALAEWMTSDENDLFVRVMANRIWADLMGRGLVEPVDDLRGTNPPSNGPLLAALAQDFRSSGYDIKKLIRRICTSYVYGLSSLPSDRNLVDTRNYSRHLRQRLRAESLLDAAVEITGVPEKFSAMPPGARATEIWTHRVESLFLDAFGRPDPNQDPPCERTADTTVVQALHLMNADNLYAKVTSDDGKPARLAATEQTPPEIITEIYLSIYSRLPSDEERQITAALFKQDGAERRKVIEDLVWALMNTPEFVFKD